MKKNLSLLFTGFLVLLFTSNLLAQFTLDGYVLYHNKPSKPIPGAEVFLKTPAGELIQTTATDGTGKYIFSNVPAGTYNLSVTTNLSAGGVTLQDSYLILLHLLNLYNFSPIQFLAADVDGNGQITWNDYLTVVFGWFLYGYPFPTGEWVFQEATVVAGLKDGNNLGGSSSADVNGSYQPNYTKADLPMEMAYKAIQEVSEGEYTEIPVYPSLTSGTHALALYFEYPSDVLEIMEVNSTLQNMEFLASGNELKVVWSNPTAQPVSLNPEVPVFTARVKTKEGFGMIHSAALTPIVGSHAIDQNGDILSNLKLTSNVLKYKPEGESTFSIFPNPVNQESHIKITLSETARVEISLFTAEGKKIASLASQDLPAGIHSIPMPSFSIHTKVMFYTCTIQGTTSNQTLSGKVLIAQ